MHEINLKEEAEVIFKIAITASSLTDEEKIDLILKELKDCYIKIHDNIWNTNPPITKSGENKIVNIQTLT